MITLIEALNYRSLKYISQPLGPFHVLIGPNASGKSTFLDVVAFLGRLVSDGFGADKPLVPNTSGSNKAKNRRVEFRISDQPSGGSTMMPR